MKNSLFNTLRTIVVTVFVLSATAYDCAAQNTNPQFKALVLTERGGLHEPYVAAALQWLNELAPEHNFMMDIYQHADPINEALLAKYKVLIQLNYPPYTWSAEAMAAFQKNMEEGQGCGWIGFHHAALLGEFDGYPMWKWFSEFMGGIRFENHIAELVSGVRTDSGGVQYE